MQWYKIFTPEIKELIEKKELKELSVFLRNLHPADTVDILRELEPADKVMAFRLLSKDKTAAIFSMFEIEEQEELLKHFAEHRVGEILSEMTPDDRTELLEELPASVVKQLLKLLPPQEREIANVLLNYPPSSAGRIMTPEYVDLKEDMAVSEALDHIRRTAPDKETIYTCYVIDKTRKLIGVASLKDIILAQPQQKTEEIMKEMVHYVKTTDDQEVVANMFQKYDLLSLPVVDSENRLVGIITVDDVLDVVQEEATEDFLKMGAVQLTEEEYLRTGFFRLAGKRIVWLVVLLILNFFTASVLQSYAALMSSLIALAFFIPMLTGAGGNTGSQAATLIIRSLATGNLSLRHWWRVLGREILMGVALGSILSLVAGGRVFFSVHDIGIAVVVGVSIIAVIVTGNLAGALLPLFFRLIKLDPAVVSAPLITSIVDVAGLFIYFEITRRLLHI
ncbi:MAG: magnesium transporter [Planctomycetes bacterium]|nr:magnesium transporter [Planctomycetota bacterium]